jgi:hypothetical protein
MPTNVPLQSIKLASTATTFVFSNIDQSYTDIRVVVSGFTSGASVDIQGKINGDTGANYSRVTFEAAGSTPSGVPGQDQTYARFGWCPSGTTYQTETLDFLNYSEGSNYKMVLQRASVNTWTYMAAINWRNTAPITSLEFTPGSGTFNAGTTFSLYGIRASNPTLDSAKAYGGNVVVTDGTYWYHAFLSSGTFTPKSNLSCAVLAVAGGGGGGNGGGGAGGIIYSSSKSLIANTGYSIVVGAGGTGKAVNTAGSTNGNNSSFDIANAIGGGSGPIYPSSYGVNGGSGGGGYSTTAGSSTQTSPSGYTGYGSAGGAGSGGYGGGGGGAGAAATGGTNTNGGNGLNTWSTWATATSTGANSGYYAGGGAGRSYGSATTGTQGFGNASTANTGGGGNAGDSSAYNGQSGIVIVRYSV